MKTLSRVAAILLILVLAVGTACADTLSLNGTIEAGETVPVYAPIGGTVESVSVEQGMRLNTGDTIFSYRTDKTYASEDGKIAGVFVQAGDDAETMTERYGADLYIEGNSVYTVSASTQKAYASAETKMIHTGESVYLMSKKGRYGVGIVTAVDGNADRPRHSGPGEPDGGEHHRRDRQCSRKERGRGQARGPAAGDADRHL